MNVSFAGCGAMAMLYLSVYRDLEWVRVHSCIGGHMESAERAAAIFGTYRPIATTDFTAALSPAVDAVIVNTPNSLHASQAVAAIEAGKHVLIQKPLAANLKDAEAIANAAARSGKTIGVYMSYFDQPLVYDLRRMIAERKLGEIVHCYARLMHTGGLTSSNTWRGSLAETGGGCFIQLSIHFTNLFEWMTGSRIVEVSGMFGRLQCPGIEGEDIASTVMRLDSGVLITLDAAWCATGEEWALHGTAGSAIYRNLLDLEIVARGETTRSKIAPPAYGDASNPFNQHRVFLEAARDGHAAPIGIATALHDMRVMQAVYESARAGRTMRVMPPHTRER